MTETGRSHSSVSSTQTAARWRRTVTTATPGQVRYRYTQIIGNMQSTGVCRPASSNNCSPLKEDFGEINVSLYNVSS